jgi:hypothetical protein
MITGLDHVSKTKIRGIFALLKTCLSLDTLPGQGDAVRLLIGKGINSFKDFRERHDTFINRVLLQQHIFLPLNLKAELFWILSPEKLNERIIELQEIENALTEFFLSGDGNVRRLNASGLAPVDTNDLEALVDSPSLPPQLTPDTPNINFTSNNTSLLSEQSPSNSYADYLNRSQSSWPQTNSLTQLPPPQQQQKFPAGSTKPNMPLTSNSQLPFQSSVPNHSSSSLTSTSIPASSYAPGLSNFSENYKGLQQQQPLPLSSSSSYQYQNKSQSVFNKAPYSNSNSNYTTDYNNPFDLPEHDYTSMSHNSTNNNNLNLFRESNVLKSSEFSVDGEIYQPKYNS